MSDKCQKVFIENKGFSENKALSETLIVENLLHILLLRSSMLTLTEQVNEVKFSMILMRIKKKKRKNRCLTK